MGFEEGFHEVIGLGFDSWFQVFWNLGLWLLRRHVHPTLFCCHSCSFPHALMSVSSLSKFCIPQSPCPFIAARKTLELLNVTTFLGGRIIALPVWRFLLLRPCFFFTENFPNPLTRTSSPFCRDCFISSKRASITWADRVLVKMFWAKSASTIRALVRVMGQWTVALSVFV